MVCTDVYTVEDFMESFDLIDRLEELQTVGIRAWNKTNIFVKVKNKTDYLCKGTVISLLGYIAKPQPVNVAYICPSLRVPSVERRLIHHPLKLVTSCWLKHSAYTQ